MFLCGLGACRNTFPKKKEKNAQTVKDSQEAQTAVAQALVVLKEFYAKAGEATSLLQQPEIFDSCTLLQPHADPIFKPTDGCWRILVSG